jgi:hypothetical protein
MLAFFLLSDAEAIEEITLAQEIKKMRHHQLIVPNAPCSASLTNEHIHAIADGGACLLAQLKETSLEGIVNYVEEKMVRGERCIVKRWTFIDLGVHAKRSGIDNHRVTRENIRREVIITEYTFAAGARHEAGIKS